MKDATVEVGTKIDIVISLGPKEEDENSDPSTDEPQTETVTVKVDIKDETLLDKEVTLIISADGKTVEGAWKVTPTAGATAFEKTIECPIDAKITVTTAEGASVEFTVSE